MTRTTPEQRADLARMLDAAMLDAGMSGPWREWGDMWIQLGTTRALIVAAVNALPDLLADLADAEAERDSLTEGVRAYGRTIDRWGRLIIEATGSEDITTPDGDGDWEVVEHRLSEVRAEQERLTVALRLAQARAADAVAATIPEPIEYPTYHDGYETGRRDGEQAARALAERAEVDIDGNLIPTWDLLNFTRRIYAHLQEAERSLKELALTRPTPAESPRPIDPAAERDALAAERDALRAMLAGRCLSDITHRDEEHRQSVCMLPVGHAPLAHDDCMGCTWTDADHWQPSAVDRVADEVARIADDSQHEDWDSPRVRSIVGRISRALDGEADR